MGFPWKKLISVGKAVGGIFYPPLVLAIDTAENAYEGIKGSGGTKLAQVKDAYAALLKMFNVDMALLSDDQREKLDKVVTEAAETYVAARNAEAAAKEAADALEVLVASFRSPIVAE